MNIKNWIPMGRLIKDIFVKSGLVDALNLTGNLEVLIGNPLDGRNLLNMGIISKAIAPSSNLDEDFISKRIIVMSGYPTYSLARFPEPPTQRYTTMFPRKIFPIPYPYLVVKKKRKLFKLFANDGLSGHA